MTNEEIIAFGSNNVMNNTDNKGVLFANHYESVYGERICGTCRAILYEKFIKFKNDFNSKKIEQMEKNIYTITEGALIDSWMSNDAPQGHYTKENITDEIAIKLLRAGIGAGYIVKKDGSEITDEDLNPKKKEDVKKANK